MKRFLAFAAAFAPLLSSPARDQVLFVGAHPDDFEACAGLALRMRSDFDVRIVDFTRGEGGCGEKGFLDGSTGRRREAEEREVARAFGTEPIFLSQVNFKGRYAFANEKVTKEIEELLLRYRPKAVFTHWPVDTHPDHVQCSAAVQHAVHNVGRDHGLATELYFYEEPPWQTMNFRPTYHVDITDQISAVTNLISLYVCQNGAKIAQNKLARVAGYGREAPVKVTYAERYSTFSGRPAPGGVLSRYALGIAGTVGAKTADFSGRLLPEAAIHPDRVSSSGWLWNAERPVADGASSFFRKTFDLAEAPVSATGHVCFDDSGAVFANGVRIPVAGRTLDAAALLKALRKGRNAIAVSVRNGRLSAGFIFRAELKMPDGTAVSLHSDETFRSAAAAPDGWERPEFDDSAWKSAVFQGDAKCLPWSRAPWATHGELDVFMTADERTKYAADERAFLTLPPDLATEPEPDAAVVYENNMPKIRVAGKTHVPDWYLGGALDKWRRSACRRFAGLGVNFVQIGVHSRVFEDAPGVYAFDDLDRQARSVLKMNPKAILMVNIWPVLEKWLAAHPEEAVQYAAGPVQPGSNDHVGRPFRGSPASSAFRAEAARAIAQMCDYVGRQPWAKRVCSVRVCWGVYQEWHMFGFWDGPDVSPAMTAAFRRYKNGKWANANPPTMAERTTGRFLYDPVQDEKVLDFMTCQQEQIADLAALFARTVKTRLPGRLVGMWYGYVLTDQAPEGANVLLDRMLANPDIDWLSNPAEYRKDIRGPGGSYLHRTIPATFHRYGKLCILEDDSRYDWTKAWKATHRHADTPAETVACVERNYLSKLFDRCGIQFVDAAGGPANRPFCFDNETVFDGLSAAMRAFAAAEKSVPADSGLDVAFVVDYHGRLQWDAQSRKTVPTGREIFSMAPIACHRSGVPFDTLTLEDYLAAKKPYRTVAFLNLFHPPAEAWEPLRSKLARDGATAIRLSPPTAPACPKLGVRTLAPEKVPTAGAAWAALFAEAGAHVYAAPGNYLRRNGDLLMFHAGTKGRHVLTLPPADRNGEFVELLHGGTFSAQNIVLTCAEAKTWLLMRRKAGASAQIHDPRYADRLYPDLIVHPARASQSGWLWNAQRPVADGAESFFRLRFALPGAVKSATLRAWFDDSGALFVNGTRLAYAPDTSEADGAALLRQLHRGENTLAVRVKNGTGAGGVIFLLEAELADGTRVTVHSDEAVKASSVSAPGWEKPGFDDSSWGQALFQADAKGAPWGRAGWAQSGVLDRFMTAAELARYAAEERAAMTLPAGIDYGPEPDAKIVYVHNMPKIRLNGRIYDPQWKMAGAADAWEASSFRRLGGLGIDFVMANVSSSFFEKAPGKYDFSCFEREAVGALRANPNARIMFGPRLLLEKWLAAHPDEAIAYAAGPVQPGSNEHRGRPFRPSAASRAYRRAACDCLARLCEWIKTRPWANRVVMIRPCWGIYQEWHTYGMWDGPDVSRPMTEAFRRYKNGKWANANPPTMAERTTGGFMYDPVKDAKVLDFFRCQQEEVADLAAEFARTVKTHLPGRLVGMWYGYVFTAQAPEGANILLDRMLANPDIDYLCDIATYQAQTRWAGGAYMHRTIPATFHRYGKMNVLEDDNRYDWLAGLDPKHASIYMRSPQESVATAERNYLSRLFDRCGIQYTDPLAGHGTRPFIIDNDTVLKGIGNARRVFRRLEDRVPADSGLDTAIVVDWRERFYWDAQTGKKRTCRTGWNLYEYAPIALYRAGTDFDLLSLDDYLASPKRYAKVVAFNLFHTPEASRAAFVAKAARDGAKVAKIAVPGYPSADLGGAETVLNDIPVTGRAWAEVFRGLGTHLYTKPDNCFRRNGDLMMFCTADAGEHVIELPAADAGKRYRDFLSGKTHPAPKLTLTCNGPATFLLAPE